MNLLSICERNKQSCKILKQPVPFAVCSKKKGIELSMVSLENHLSKTFMLRSGEVETVKVHDFVPHLYKVVQELLLGVLTSVDFCQGPELGVRTED
jgi:hypothetical protein